MAERFDKTNYKPGFRALFVTQFQGAFSDNLFKYILIFFLLEHTYTEPSGMSEWQHSNFVASWATILFSLPFIFFPGIFGTIADRFSKQKIAVAAKILEAGIMGLGGVALYMGDVKGLWAMLFLMATQSALFSPAKYGLLPETLPEERLSWGNGILQMGTMVAIIAGVAVAGPAYEILSVRELLPWVSGGLVALAFVGLISALRISKPPAANEHGRLTINPFKGMATHFRLFYQDKWLGMAIMGYTYFWFAGALLLANLVSFGNATLKLSEIEISMMSVALSMGIGVGAVGAGYLSRGKVEAGLLPLGSLGMALCCGLLAWDGFEFTSILALLFGLGFFGGVFDVPLAATIQLRSPDSMKGGILATTNMLTFLGTAGAGLFLLTVGQRLDPYAIFLIAAIMTLGVGIYISALFPVAVLRLHMWMLVSSLYRLRVLGRTNVPKTGGALLVANHTSFLDALVILASIDRPVRFLMYKGFYDVRWIRPLAKIMGAIPVSPGMNPRDVVTSLKAATEAIEAGDLVCIFAEGQITRTGQLLPFHKGFERVMKGVDAPIIPVYLDQVWGSIFSFSGQKFFWKRPRKIPYSLTVAFGEAMPAETNAQKLRSVIQELGTDAYATRKPDQPLLHRLFAKKARRHPFMLALADARSGKMSYIKTLAASIVLARKLKAILGPEKMIGILLPQSVGGALVNIALPFMGKVPVNLNYTSSNQLVAAAAKECNMKQVITASAFLDQVPVEVPGEAIYVDKILKTVTAKDRIIGLLLAALCPLTWIEKHLGAPSGRTSDELATVIFSSGSEGEPKGVMLTHFNVLSNVDAGIQGFPLNKGDRVMGILPFFHSFGYTGTLWLVLTQRLSAVYHTNPLEAKQIGGMVAQYKTRVLFTTSTFLQGLTRRCSPAQLSSLEFVIAGAEKLSPRIRDAFKEKYGVEPLEGYGTTECSPVVSLNVPDYRAPGFYQIGTKRGSIGHPIPGMSVRVIDPETREPLEQGETGLLLVKGPNVMKGYLNQPEKTAKVLQDGWYETGDIAVVDDDGFITITDRLARFSKIAGEMVSHTKVEESLQSLLEESERVLAVAGVPDAQKGERLVVLHTLEDAQFDTLISKIDDTGLPKLWIPKSKAYYRVDEIPILGTGKMDLSKVKELARQLDAGE
jgi:acyl-[acyl-carrier-protein]-phospholipid O-acyltransferase/long-chain-fatty-acid--[acyl-carrier-protein] ligase